MEHFSIAPHPKDFFLPYPCFAHRFTVVWTKRMVRWGWGAGTGLEQYDLAERCDHGVMQVAQYETDRDGRYEYAGNDPSKVYHTLRPSQAAIHITMIQKTSCE